MTIERTTTVLDPHALKLIHKDISNLITAQAALRSIGWNDGNGPVDAAGAGYAMEVFADAIQGYTNSILERLESLEDEQRKEVSQ